MSQYFKIGKFAASHGHSGELIIKHHLGKQTSLEGAEAVFIQEAPGKFMPYFIQNATAKNDSELFINLEGIDTMEQARRLTPKEVWITEEDFQKFASKAAPISMLGYHLIHDKEDLGEIIEVLEQPHQVLCTILYKGNEALIPVHPQNLLKVDAKNKKVFVDIPEGLLEIYEA